MKHKQNEIIYKTFLRKLSHPIQLDHLHMNGFMNDSHISSCFMNMLQDFYIFLKKMCVVFT